jgi:hypothetical protein
MAHDNPWTRYEGDGRIALALVLLAIAAGVVYAGSRLRRPVRARQPGQTVAYVMLTVWAVSIVAFLGCLATISHDEQQANLGHAPSADPIGPWTFTAVAVVFGIIAILGPQDWPARLGGAAIGALAAPMIFELPFDLIVIARIHPPYLAGNRVLFFTPLFVIEIMTLSLLTLSPMVRLTRATFFAFAAMLAVFAVWALAGFGYPSTPVYYTCNVVSKILAFVTVLTLFQPRALWAAARARVGARSGSGTASGADGLLDQGAAEAPD